MRYMAGVEHQFCHVRGLRLRSCPVSQALVPRDEVQYTRSGRLNRVGDVFGDGWPGGIASRMDSWRSLAMICGQEGSLCPESSGEEGKNCFNGPTRNGGNYASS